jgi:mRNA interferase YafQ
MYQIEITNKFEQDVKRCKKRGWDRNLLDVAIELLSNNIQLPVEYKAHPLKNKTPKQWDCHIKPDWVLLYEIDDKNKVIKLIRTGSHSDLFG